MNQEREEDKKRIDYSLLRRLLSFLRPYRIQIAGAVVLTLTASALGPLRPKLTQIAIDDHIVTGDVPGLALLVGIIVAALLMQGALQYLLSMLMSWVGQRVLLDIRVTLYRHVQGLAIRFYDTTPVGRIVTRVTNDVEVLNELFSSGVVMMISDFMVIVWILVFMLQTSVTLTLLTIVILPFLLLASIIFRMKVRKVYDKIRRQVALMNAFMNEFITGIGVVQLFRQEGRMSGRFGEINKEHRRLQDQSIVYYATFYPVVEFLSMIALCIIMWYAARTILGGEMTVGILVAFTQFTEMFFRPIRDLTEKYNTLQSSAVASERIFSLLDLKEVIPDRHDAVPFTKLREGISLRGVGFSYDNSRDILHDVSFDVHRGETVALVGATGAGKSSIINLLCRFYEFQRGDILIDGHSIRQYKQETLRARTAIVLQDVFLFSRSIRENITLDRSHISAADVEAAAKALGAHDFIASLPHGYETNVRERGAILSSGQKQLVSFCRALVTDPDILILDEATSNIDSETEKIIEHSISTLLRGRTSIVIAHRLSTIQRADRIVVMHHGGVAEMGTHKELLKKDGLYAKLHRLQFAHASVS
ncbi:MAG: ABC transporter ATP-binding protein [Ignavibacteria bacterium]|nr:ABC transporter ATP-binding protein [Ignavibacteria bacterium]